MALRPQILLRRRAGAVVPPPASPIAQRIAEVNRRHNATSSFPLLPAVAAALILLGAAQLFFWWWQSRLPAASEISTGNPFVQLIKSLPSSSTPEGRLRPPQRIAVTVLPQNLQFGDAFARVTVTIFTDPACGPCREKVRSLTSHLPTQGVRLVYKFWPTDPARVTPGMLIELARRQNVTLPFWRAIQGAGAEDLSDEQLLTMLDRAGLPLAAQRQSLVAEGPTLLATLEPDLNLAKNASLPASPVLAVDDYILDGEVLSPSNLSTYVRKRLEGRQIMEKDDLWLMRK